MTIKFDSSWFMDLLRILLRRGIGDTFYVIKNFCFCGIVEGTVDECRLTKKICFRADPANLQLSTTPHNLFSGEFQDQKRKCLETLCRVMLPPMCTQTSFSSNQLLLRSLSHATLKTNCGFDWSTGQTRLGTL